jgi:hypothetical protein
MDNSRRGQIIGAVALVVGSLIFVLVRPGSVLDRVWIVLILAIGWAAAILSWLIPTANKSLLRKLTLGLSVSTSCILVGILLVGNWAPLGTALIIIGILLKRFVVFPMIKNARKVASES